MTAVESNALRRLTAARLSVGGSELLLAFLAAAVRLSASHLLIATAFAESAALSDDFVQPLWDRLVHRAETRLVVRTAGAAVAVTSARGGTAVAVRVHERLHAKAFVAWRGSSAVALLGSQNLTPAGLHTNTELGILLRSGHSAALDTTVARLRACLETIWSSATPHRPISRRDGNASFGGSKRRPSDRATLTERTGIPRRTRRNTLA